MNGFDAMAEVLKREGTEYLFCFPTLTTFRAHPVRRAGTEPRRA